MEALTAQGRDSNRIRVVNSRSRVGEEFPENLRRFAKWGQTSTLARMRENVLLALPLLSLLRLLLPYLLYEEYLHGFRIKKKFGGRKREREENGEKSRILFFIDFPRR